MATHKPMPSSVQISAAHPQPQSKLSEWMKFLTDQSQKPGVFKFSGGIQKNAFMFSDIKTPIKLLTNYVYYIALITTL